MPYIDKQYAEELLKKSQASTNGGPFRAAGGTEQEACSARKSRSACFGSLDQSELQPKSHARSRLQNVSLSLAPIMVEHTEDETKAFEKVTRLACARERGSR